MSCPLISLSVIHLGLEMKLWEVKTFHSIKQKAARKHRQCKLSHDK